MVLIGVLFLIIMELIAWNLYRDIKCSAILFGVMWIISLLNLQYMGLTDYISTSALLIIISGAFVFQVGFNFGTHVKCNYREYTANVNIRAVKVLIFIITIAAIPVVWQYMKFISSYGGSFYDALTSADENLNLPSFFSYYRKIVQFLFLSFATIYWMDANENRKILRPYMFVLFIIATLATISVPTRNSLLFYILPLLMVWICTHRTSNKRIALIFVTSVIGFLLIFYLISLGKYWYLYSAGSTSNIDVILSEIRTYLSGSIAAFSSTYKIHSFTRMGENTFRFVIAVCDAIFGTDYAVPLVNEFVKLNNGAITNVYTFYDFYIRDFGAGYALLVQFILAVIHGVNYKKAVSGNRLSIFLFAMLSYPLMMQFFQDQYFSLTSTWIQILVIGLLVFKSNIFFNKSYID